MENTTLPTTIDVDQLAEILHKTPGAILVDRSHPRRKHLIPPALKNTGGKKLLWSLDTVRAWLQKNEEPAPTSDFLTLDEVADELGCALRTLQNQRTNLPFPTTKMMGRVVVARKHLDQYKNSIIQQAEKEFQQQKNKGVVELKRGRGRPKKLPDFAGLGG